MRFTQRNVTDADTRTRHTLRTDLPHALSAFPPFTIRLGQLKNKIKQQKSLPGVKIVCLICSGYLRRHTRSSCFVNFPNLAGGREGVQTPRLPYPSNLIPTLFLLAPASLPFFDIEVYFFPRDSTSPFFSFLPYTSRPPFPRSLPISVLSFPHPLSPGQTELQVNAS